MSNPEQEFQELIKDVSERIKANLKKASDYLEEAILISDKYGIPFDAEISSICQRYTPHSINHLTDEQKEIIKTVYSLYEINDYLCGWEQSRICY